MEHEKLQDHEDDPERGPARRQEAEVSRLRQFNQQHDFSIKEQHNGED
jgi:hypothetical protein